jgi:transposase
MWLHELLSPHVDEIVVVSPKKRREGSKSDARDARGLAEDLRTGAVKKRVFKAGRAYQELRSAVRGYGALVQDVVRVKNRLRSVYYSRGVHGMGEAIYDATKRREWMSRLPPSYRKLAILLGQELEALGALRDRSEERLLKEARKHESVRRLTTVPGIGFIRAAQVVSVVVTPHRFRTKRQFWSYCGLAVVTHTSADWKQVNSEWVRAKVVQTRGLNRNKNALLKEVFKGAATTVISRLPEHPLRQNYRRMLDAGTRPNLAKLTLARRIASAVLAIWKKEEEYDPSKHCSQKPE